METLCQICGENYNRSTRIKICCEYCDMTCCRLCSETFLLGQTFPHCMNNECKKKWTRKFMANNFTNEFIKNKYKKHCEEILFNHEQSLLPATQLIIDRDNYKMSELSRIYDDIYEYNSQIAKISAKIMRLRTYETQLNDGTFTIGVNELSFDGNVPHEPETSAKFTYRCSKEDCRGFLSSRWKCSLCNTWTCNKCLVNVGENENKDSHVCNQDDLKTAKTIKSDCKPCPSCSVSIFKIDGCDQMFCTNCNKPFSWKTGKILVGSTIHNPHYFEYLNSQNQHIDRNPLDIPCGAELNGNSLIKLRECEKFVTRFVTKLEHADLQRIGRNILHLSHEVIASLIRRLDECANIGQKNRLHYMRKIIDEIKFKKCIQINEKNHDKYREQIDLYVMVRDTATDILRRFCSSVSPFLDKCVYDSYRSYRSHHSPYNDPILSIHLTSLETVQINDALKASNAHPDQIYGELEYLQIYANGCLNDISKTYKSIKKEFDFEYKLVNVAKKTREMDDGTKDEAKKQSAEEEPIFG